MMHYRAWHVTRPDEAAAKALARQLGITELLGRILVARGMDAPEKAQSLLARELPLSDPFLLKDMDKAVERILRAVEQEEPIVVFGDYDVDGVTATAILYEYLHNLGAQVRCKLPSREEDGYGLNKAVLKSLAEKGYRLVITVDNGISAVEEAAYAKELGIDLVITDHHLPPEPLPQAVAVVDPQRKDDESPFKGFSGAGVAFKLCAALEQCPPEEMLDLCGDLAAIGTVADVMPLLGENRTLVQQGLEQLQSPIRPGLQALIQVAGMAEREITAESISFGMAPRLNSAGRMGSATTALRLLLCEDEEQAAQIAEELNQSNQERQRTEQEIMAEVQQQLEAHPERTQDRVILAWGEGYHQGVIGIVASRLVERYDRPAIVISVQNGEGKGSGRSLPGFHLHSAISSCASLLVRYGGHAMAAGLTLREENIEAFRQGINRWAVQQYPVFQLPPFQMDVAVRLEQLTVEQVAGVARLAPFGNGNAAPVYLLEDAVLDGVYAVSAGRHCRLRLRQGDQVLYAAYFGVAPGQLPYAPGDRVDVALSLSIYEGKTGPQISGRIKGIRPAGLGNEAAAQAALFEAFQAGVPLTPEQRAQLRPSREDTVALYRLIREGRVQAGDLQPLFARLGPDHAGKLLTSLQALEQLGLVGQQEQEGGSHYRVLPSAEKKDLASAPVLQSLREAD